MATDNGKGKRSPRRQPQVGLEDKLLDYREELQSALEEHHSRNNSRKELARQTKEARAKVEALTADLGVGVYRVGAFTITISTSEGKHVEFDTEGGKRSARYAKDKDPE